MVKTVSLAAGLAVGYVLGARAGREKYNQIAETARRWAGQPPVVRAQAAVTDALADVKEAIADTAAKSGGTKARKSSAASTSVNGSGL